MDKKLQVGVKIFLKNQNGEYLLLKRSSTKYPDVTRPWDIVGGRIYPGTDLLSNLKREIEEETGMMLVKQPKIIAAQDILRPDKHVVRLTYIGSIEGDVTLDEDHDDFQWVSRENMLKIKGLDEFVEELLQNPDLDEII